MIKNLGYKIIIAVLLLMVALTFSFAPLGKTTALHAEATLNFPNTAAGTSSDLTMTLTGADVGDCVMLGAPDGSVPSNGGFFAWVSDDDEITVRFINNALLASIDPASGTFMSCIVKN